VSAHRYQPVALAGLAALCCALCAGILPVRASAFETNPQWTVTAVPTPAVFVAGNESGEEYYRVVVENTGDAQSNGETVTITDTLPAGLKPAAPTKNQPGAAAIAYDMLTGTSLTCKGFTCLYAGPVAADDTIELTFRVDVEPTALTGEVNTVTVSGGGAPEASTSGPITVSPSPSFPGFGWSFPGAFSEIMSNTQAGAHADLITNGYFNTDQEGNAAENVKDAAVVLPPGFAGDGTRTPYCTAAQLKATVDGYAFSDKCPIASQVGVASITLNFRGFTETETYKNAYLIDFVEPMYNMEPLGGEVARLGWKIDGTVTNIVTSVVPGTYQLRNTLPNLSGALEVMSSQFSVWGIPVSSEHNPWRGLYCTQYSGLLNSPSDCDGEPGKGPSSTSAPAPFLSNPTQCTGSPLTATAVADTWQHPGLPSEPMATWSMPPLTGCNALGFNPAITLQATTNSAETPTGLNVNLDIPQTYGNASAIATSHMKNVVVTLPQGMTINPSAGAGLGSCSAAQYASEQLTTPPGGGCPNDSSLGTVTIETPVLHELVTGTVFVAKPYENPFDSLLALYVIAKIPARGVIIKSAGKIVANPVTGQLVTTFENNPQLPFNKFTLAFRPGEAAPLVSPPACGEFRGKAEFTSWSEPEEVLTNLSPSFPVTQGVGGGACPSGGVPPFNPTIISGTVSNAAGTYSPFYLRIIRNDGEQELVRFTTKFPPGLSGNLSGVPFCPDADIEAAKTVTGQQETEHPSCPAASEIGHELIGAGVGGVEAQTTGKIYLAGPYHGSGLSVVSITSADVGPFDLGTVVIRFALRINPINAQVEIDATGSDPIPHIIDGIVVHVRDIRVYIDRPQFILNPTNCNPLGITAAITGAGADYTNPADEMTVDDSERFQTADCSSLTFNPSFKASTSGKTSKENGASLTAKLSYPVAPLGHEANISMVKVELPKQLPSRLTTLQKACKAAVFDANPAACPAASIVGHATAETPILPVPLVGPAYFVSHGGESFPSLVIVLTGYGDVKIELVGSTFINKAGITSSTFKTVPDVPVGSFELTFPQGPYSALAANGNLCKAKTLAMPTEFLAQNGVTIRQSTKINVTGCPKAKKVSHKKKKGKDQGRGGEGRRERQGEEGVGVVVAVALRACGVVGGAVVRGDAAAGGVDRRGVRRGVADIQRARMTEALAEVARERGVGGVTVSHIVARSGVSRRTFYELFEDREDCFLAAFDQAVERARQRVAPVFRGPGAWRERVRDALGELLGFLDDEPGMGALCIVDALGAGPVALERRARVVEALIDAVEEGRGDARGSARPTRLTAEGVVGAVLAVLHARLAGAGDGNGLGSRRAGEPMVGLLGPLMGMIVLPYRGQAAAAREASRPAPRRRRAGHPRGDPLRELGMRLTYRTVRVLLAIAEHPGASNRQVADASGVVDQGQISKLLARLEHLGLIHNGRPDSARGEPNVWSLTARGEEIEHAIRRQTTPGGGDGQVDDGISRRSSPST
jgi:AcrR family transcriptional regulator